MIMPRAGVCGSARACSTALAERSGVQQRLGDAVPDRRQQGAIVNDHPVDLLGEVAEAVHGPSGKERRKVVPHLGQRPFEGEDWRTSARAGVLDLGAVSDDDLAVLEHKQHGHGGTGLPDLAEPRRERRPDVEKPVGASARTDRRLVVAVEPGQSRLGEDGPDPHSITSPPLGPRVWPT